MCSGALLEDKSSSKKLAKFSCNIQRQGLNVSRHCPPAAAACFAATLAARAAPSLPSSLRNITENFAYITWHRLSNANAMKSACLIQVQNAFEYTLFSPLLRSEIVATLAFAGLLQQTLKNYISSEFNEVRTFNQKQNECWLLSFILVSKASNEPLTFKCNV